MWVFPAYIYVGSTCSVTQVCHVGRTNLYILGRTSSVKRGCQICWAVFEEGRLGDGGVTLIAMWCRKGWGLWVITVVACVDMYRKRNRCAIWWNRRGCNGLVRISETLILDKMCPNWTKPTAIASQTYMIWQERCFFFILEDGSIVLMTTERLSPISSLVLSTRSRQQSLYQISIMRSIAVRAAIILEPKVDVTIVHLQWQSHMHGMLLMRMRILVTDWCVIWLRAWSASTKVVILVGSPIGSGHLVSRSSMASGKKFRPFAIGMKRC